MLKKFLMISIGLSFSLSAIAAPQSRCMPNQKCWPSQKDWDALQSKLSTKLLKPTLPLAPCKINANSKACKEALKEVKNPFALQRTAGGTETQRWYKAWHAQPSAYAVEAHNAQDVVAAVNFARKYNLRLVIKGAGHDYLGRSSAPDSLLVWTAKMSKVTYDKSFVPSGCPKSQKGIPAITVQAGTRWVDAYNVATNQHGQYVQGGGCPSVGAAGGFTQGSGFGSLSKKYGTGAAAMLQAKVVTADGRVLIANRCQNKDLFWALRGGGGGTYGIATKMTLRTYKLPKTLGFYSGTLTAKNNQAYKKLIHEMLLFFRNKLDNQHWGENMIFNKNNTISLSLTYQGLTIKQVANLWQPLKSWIKKSPNNYSMKSNITTLPPKDMWNLKYRLKHLPKSVRLDTGKGALKSNFWWESGDVETYIYLYTYQSWWLPTRLLDKQNIKQTSDLFYKATRYTNVMLHTQKALGGASKGAIQRSKETSITPAAYKAAALILMYAGSNDIQPGIKGQKQANPHKIKKDIANVNAAMKLFMDAAPNAGSYANEANYFQKNWQKDFWGSNYPRLLKIKQKYDPNGLFYCHHCVGSELWTDHGNRRKN